MNLSIQIVKSRRFVSIDEEDKYVLAIIIRCTLRTEMHSSHFDRSIDHSILEIREEVQVKILSKNNNQI